MSKKVNARVRVVSDTPAIAATFSPETSDAFLLNRKLARLREKKDAIETLFTDYSKINDLYDGWILGKKANPFIVALEAIVGKKYSKISNLTFDEAKMFKHIWSKLISDNFNFHFSLFPETLPAIITFCIYSYNLQGNAGAGVHFPEAQVRVRTDDDGKLNYFIHWLPVSEFSTQSVIHSSVEWTKVAESLILQVSEAGINFQSNFKSAVSDLDSRSLSMLYPDVAEKIKSFADSAMPVKLSRIRRLLNRLSDSLSIRLPGLSKLFGLSPSNLSETGKSTMPISPEQFEQLLVISRNALHEEINLLEIELQIVRELHMEFFEAKIETELKAEVEAEAQQPLPLKNSAGKG